MHGAAYALLSVDYVKQMTFSISCTKYKHRCSVQDLLFGPSVEDVIYVTAPEPACQGMHEHTAAVITRYQASEAY